MTREDSGGRGDPGKRGPSRRTTRIAERKPLLSVERQPPAQAGFDRLEWQVIALARSDSLASIYPRSRFARLSHWLFGGRQQAPLANPRLEALRRAAVFAWHYGDGIPPRLVATFSEAGFSGDQRKLLTRMVAAQPPSKGTRVSLFLRLARSRRDHDREGPSNRAS